MFAAIALALAPAAIPDNGWVTFEQPLIAPAVSLGCHAGDVFDLDDRDEAWIVNRKTGQVYETFTFYVKMEEGVPVRSRAVTPDCVVADAGEVTQLDAAPADVIEMVGEWLQRDAFKDDLESQLLAGVAQIDHEDATALLEREAGDVSRNGRGDDALFWLANRRGEAGREIVIEHLDERWPLDHRKQAVMSLALSKHANAWDKVRDVARNAREAELRAHAVTALAITDAPNALADLHSIFMADAAEEVRRQAIFGLAQVDTEEAAETLIAIARDPRHGNLRRDALFWLANMDSKSAEQMLDELVDSF